MAGKTEGLEAEADAAVSEDMGWDHEWEDNDSTAAVHESQHIVPSGSTVLLDPDEEEMENEIRANLSSRITSSLHAYKVAGFALIVALVSFTINTVAPAFPLLFLLGN